MEEQDPGPCPAPLRLEHYRDGMLDQAAADEIRDHMCLCKVCKSRYLDEIVPGLDDERISARADHAALGEPRRS